MNSKFIVVLDSYSTGVGRTVDLVDEDMNENYLCLFIQSLGGAVTSVETSADGSNFSPLVDITGNPITGISSSVLRIIPGRIRFVRAVSNMPTGGNSLVQILKVS